MKWINKLAQHQKAISLILGGLSVLALPPYYQFPIAILCFSGLFYLLINSHNLKHSFALGYWFGFGHFSLGFSWVGNALLIDINTLGWLYPITILASGAFFGIFIGLATIFISKFSSTKSKLLAFSAFWTLSEWLRSFVLTGFPWNLIGSVLTFLPQLYQSASIFGTYGLSLITILFCSAPVLLFSPCRSNKLFALGILLFIPLTNYFYGHNRLNHYQNHFAQDGITIRLVQPSIPQTLKWDIESAEYNFAKHIELSQQNGLENIDLVLWGETASPFPLDIDTHHRQQLNIATPSNGYLMTGVVRTQKLAYGRYIPHNSLLIFDSSNNIIDYYDKSHLVPFGEYIPLRKYLPSWITPITNTIANFQAGSGPRSFHLPNIPPFGVAICYEIIFPHQIINPNNRPQWLINITNDGWYGDSAGPRQHLVSTILRATEEGLTIARVANNGISAVISPLGNIIDQIPLNYVGTLDVTLPHNLSIYTIYAHYGNSIPLALTITLIILAIALSIQSKRCNLAKK